MRIVLAGLLVVGLAATANANGRDPYTSTINFQRGNEQHIVAGMTFGAVVSKDGGATWEWMCERAIGYGGNYDPDYIYTSTGAVFATTFDGLKVSRDGCSFVSTPPGMTFVSEAEGGPDGALYYAAADAADSKIYRSVDDGNNWPVSANPGQPGDWWSSLAVAPSNAQRIYVTGYRLDGVNPKVNLLFTSTDRGVSYTPMTMTGITTVSANSVLEVVGISPTTDTTLYLKVSFENGQSGDSIYRSTNAGQSWTKILSKDSIFGLAFLAKDATTCVAGTREAGAFVSTNCATATTPTWTELTTAPHIGCLHKDSAGTVWACTQNYDSVLPTVTIPSDGYGIMKTTDLTNWTGVLKYQDIKAPVACAAGTDQEDKCVQRYMDQPSQWCCLVKQLFITSTAIDCSGTLSCTYVPSADGAVDAGTNVKPPPDDDCCGTGNGRSSAILSLLVATVLLFRRRRP
jgi:hypothetical protein